MLTLGRRSGKGRWSTVNGRYHRKAAAVAITVILSTAALTALQRFRSPRRFREPPALSWEQGDANAEFHFTRLVYESGGGGWRRRGSWATDYPEAEYHFMQGVRRLTRIDAAAGSKLVQLLDDSLFDYPWLYAVEVGRWYLGPQEAERLREYLLRGGFLIVDDFHGTYQWAVFMSSMRRVFPDRPVLEIEAGDPILHVLYDLDNGIQIPGIQYVWSGSTYERDGIQPHWRGILDDDGRLMVAINFNMDLGDAWEHADTPEYPEQMTALAYRFGINYILYAMTH